MSTQRHLKRLVFRWTTLKGLTAIIIFLIVAFLIEYLIVLYAINLGVKETANTLLQWSFKFPRTEWTVTIAISPLFHLVPISVIITLVSVWAYLTRHVTVKPLETRKEKAGFAAKRGNGSRIKKFFGKIKAGLLKVKGVAYFWQKIHFARTAIKNALIVVLVFGTFILLVSLLAYPQLICQTISNAYKGNPSLLNFVKGTADALAPIGGIFAAINNALLSIAPGFRNFVSSLGAIFKPIADLDNVGKYLVFQNVAAWASVVVALFYGKYTRKGYRYKKGRKS